MIVYGSSFSPFVRKTLAVISEKGLTAEVKPVRFQDQDPAFRAASPFGKMPGFRDGDFTISDSTAIITYLEALHPEPALLPAEAKARARTIWFEEFGDTILVATMGKVFFNRIVSPTFLGQPGDLALAEMAEKKEFLATARLCREPDPGLRSSGRRYAHPGGPGGGQPVRELRSLRDSRG